MDLDKARSIGLFGRKIFIGHFFMEKDRGDFKSDEEYQKACDAAEKNEYLLAREPGQDEVKVFSSVDPDSYKEAPEQLKLERYKEYEANKKLFTPESERIALACITGSSFKSGDKEAALDDVRALVRSRAPLLNFYLRKWMELLVGFEKKSVKS